MALKPSTRNFLISAGTVSGVLALVLLRNALILSRNIGEDPEQRAQTLLIQGSLLGVILVLGIGFAWVRLLLDRRERRKRRPPLTLE